MTQGGNGEEPTLGDVLAAVNALSERTDLGFSLMETRFGEMGAAIESLSALAYTHERQLQELSARTDRLRVHMNNRFGRVDAALAQVRGDLAEVKADAALLESAVEETREAVQRHLDDPGAHGHAA